MCSGGIPMSCLVLRPGGAIESPETFPAGLTSRQGDVNSRLGGNSGKPAQASLISTLTPAARSSFISASTVWAFGCTMSSNRL